MKTCTKCGVPKEKTEFYVCSGKLRSRCKLCEIEISTEWAIKNAGRVRDLARERQRKNPEPNRRRCLEYRQANLENVRATDRKRGPAKSRTPKAKAARSLRRKIRYATDLGYRSGTMLRARLSKATSAQGVHKISTTMSLLGCPPIWLEIYLASLFKPGMTWENQGSVWHIDHIKPCAKFDLSCPEEQQKCFHWTNLQPLFAQENFKKSDATPEQPPKRVGSACCQPSSFRQVF